MENELDFDADATHVKPKQKYNPNRATTMERLLAIMTIVFVLAFIAGIGVEWRFWMLRTTGRWAEARVLQKESRVFGWAPGVGLPLVETELRYGFVDPHDQFQEKVIWLRSGAGRYQVGDALPVIHSRWNSANNMPGSFGHHFATDSIWMMMLLLDIIALIGMVICVWAFVFLRKRRIRRWKFLMAVSASENQDDTDMTGTTMTKT